MSSLRCLVWANWLGYELTIAQVMPRPAARAVGTPATSAQKPVRKSSVITRGFVSFT